MMRTTASNAIVQSWRASLCKEALQPMHHQQPSLRQLSFSSNVHSTSPAYQMFSCQSFTSASRRSMSKLAPKHTPHQQSSIRALSTGSSFAQVQSRWRSPIQHLRRNLSVWSVLKAARPNWYAGRSVETVRAGPIKKVQWWMDRKIPKVGFKSHYMTGHYQVPLLKCQGVCSPGCSMASSLPMSWSFWVGNMPSTPLQGGSHASERHALWIFQNQQLTPYSHAPLLVISTVHNRFRDFGPYVFMMQNFAASWANLVRPWTVITSCFSHMDTSHILVNLFSFYFMGQAAMSILSVSQFASLYMLAGLAGNAVQMLWHPVQGTGYNRQPAFALGASGAISGGESGRYSSEYPWARVDLRFL